MKRHIVRFALGFVVLLLLLGHAARVYQFGFINRLDAIIYDTKVRLTMPQGVDDRIAILDIDEKSLGELGRWPWGRDRMSQLVKKLFDQHGIVILGFDVVFAEPDDSSGLKVLEGLAKSELKDVAQYQSALRALLPQLDHDGRFAETLKGRPVILGYYFSGRSGGVSSGAIPPPVLPEGSFTGRNIPFTVWAHYGGNLEQFQKAALSGGHFNPLVDFDGISRRVPLLAEYQGAYYEALSLAMVRALLGQPKVAPWYPEAGWFSSKSYQGMEAIDLPTARGTLRIPVDDNVSALIPYRGYQGSYRYYSISDIMADRLKPGELKGKIALIGTTAPGLLDLRATPVGEAYPGVEIHANLISGMLDGAIKQKPSYVLGAEVVILLLSGLVMVFLLPLLSPLRATLASLLVLLFVVTVNLFFWHYGNLVLPLGTGLLMVLALFALNMSYGYFVESRTKRQFTDLFGQYVPPELVEEMSRNPESYSMDGRKEELTVLFSDVRGFTTISEGLTPDELTRLMNEYLSAMTEVIRKNRGTLDKYIGDAIMAIFGAPTKHRDDALRSVLAGLEMTKALEQFNDEQKRRGKPEFKIGVGINYGVVTVGNIGCERKMNYTVIGDPVNLASRLEGQTKTYHQPLLMSQAVRDRVKDEVPCRQVDKIAVKGKREGVSVFTARLSLTSAEEKAWPIHENAVSMYYARDFKAAAEGFREVLSILPDDYLATLYLDRARRLSANPPPPDWDGVEVLTEK